MKKKTPGRSYFNKKNSFENKFRSFINKRVSVQFTFLYFMSHGEGPQRP